MPCRCDGYSVSDTEKIDNLQEKLKATEDQLCNARSLIHKLINLAGNGVELTAYPPELRERARAHIELLAKHKRSEHEADVLRHKREMDHLDQEVERFDKTLFDGQIALNLKREKLAAMRRKLEDIETISNEELLGK